MNVTLKIDDALCKEARHRAVDAEMSLSGWVVKVIKKELKRSPYEGKNMADLLAAEDGRGFEEFLPDRKADTERSIQFP